MAFGLGVGNKILVIFVVKVLCSALSNIAFFANNFRLFNAKNKLKLVPFGTPYIILFSGIWLLFWQDKVFELYYNV